MNKSKTVKNESRSTSSYSPAVRITCWTLAILMGLSLIATSVVYFAV